MAASAIGRSVLKSRSSSLSSITKSSSQILQPSPYLSHSLRPFSANSGSDSGDRPPSEKAQPFPRYDNKHWSIHMDRPGGVGANKQQMIDCYVQTLATVLGSEEEAKKKIYKVCCSWYYGFGCEIDKETSNKLEGLPGVTFVLPDSYVDDENDYGAELFVNGEIVQRSPKRQMGLEPIALRAQDIPTDNDPESLCQAHENSS